jgi:hypothetical protein
VLVRCTAGQAADLIQAAADGRTAIEERAMAQARLDDGATLLALNQIFVGHCSHQSARYRLRTAGTQLRQMETGGAIFADGIETDKLPSDWGRRADVHLAPARLRLVIPA